MGHEFGEMDDGDEFCVRLGEKWRSSEYGHYFGGLIFATSSSYGGNRIGIFDAARCKICHCFDAGTALASARNALLSGRCKDPISSRSWLVCSQGQACLEPSSLRPHAATVFEGFVGHLRVLSHGLPTHRLACLGQGPMLHLLDARLGHFSDPFLNFLPVLLCDLSFAPRCAPKKVTSMSPSFKRAAVCLTLEYGHPSLLWMARSVLPLAMSTPSSCMSATDHDNPLPMKQTFLRCDDNENDGDTRVVGQECHVLKI